MALTLVDYFKQSNSPLQKAFIADLLRYSDVISVIPWTTEEGLEVSATRWQTLPSTGFRKIGNGYNESTGKTEQIAETMALMGGDVKLDRIFDKVGNVRERLLATQMKMKAKAITFQFTDSFVNGSQAVDPDSFEGIKVRNGNMPARMSIDLAVATDSLKVLLSDATMHTFLDALHEMITRVSPTHLFMNENTKLKVSSVLRRLKVLDTTRDQFDREVESFRGVPLVDVGLKGDKSTEIITSTEDPGDGGNDATSIYPVRLDTDEGLHGIQLQGTGMDVYDPLNGGEMEAGPQLLRRIDWALGLMNVSQYCIGRIKGFKMAAA